METWRHMELPNYSRWNILERMKDIPYGIAAQFRGELAKRRISDAQLAEETGISVSSIRRKIWLEERDLTIAEAWAIAIAVGVPLSTIVTNAENGAHTQGAVA